MLCGPLPAGTSAEVTAAGEHQHSHVEDLQRDFTEV